MDNCEPARDLDATTPLMSPRPFLLASLLAGLIGAFAPAAHGGVPSAIQIGTLVLGCVLAGGAVAIAPRSPVVLGLAGVAALAMSFGFIRVEWDSAVLLLRIGAVVAGGAAVVQCFPRRARRAIVSILIILHFGGIVTAATTVPPCPWLESQLWTYFYRPYLQFMFLNNSYRFYSPAPEPTTLLWFCIEYQSSGGEKNWRWVKEPAFDDKGLPIRTNGTRLWPGLEYIRRTSLADNVGSAGHAAPDEVARQRRFQAVRSSQIPLDPEVAIDEQFRPPAGKEQVTLWLSSCVRHLAYTCPFEGKPQLDVTGIKVYVVIHSTLEPRQIAAGMNPDDPTTYCPYYWGEFDKDGNANPYVGATKSAPRPDPLLYWLIPIVREPIGPDDRQVLGDDRQRIKNYVYRHAGVSDRGELP